MVLESRRHDKSDSVPDRSIDQYNQSRMRFGQNLSRKCASKLYLQQKKRRIIILLRRPGVMRDCVTLDATIKWLRSKAFSRYFLVPPHFLMFRRLRKESSGIPFTASQLRIDQQHPITFSSAGTSAKLVVAISYTQCPCRTPQS